jgi:hypothetical protein
LPGTVEPRGAAGVLQEHQREQAGDLGFVGHELVEDPAEADGFDTQISADGVGAGCGGVALVEEEIDHSQ